MGIETLIGGGLSLLSGAMGSDAASSAAAAQSASADKAAALQQQQFQQQQQNIHPFLQGGAAANNQLLQLLGIGGNPNAANYGSQAQNFSMKDFQADPGYQFRLTQGLQGLDRTAAARGGLISGQALKAASGFAGQQASDEYQNAYNRYNANRQNILSPLMGLSGQGVGAANSIGQAGQNYANQAGNAYMGAGNAAASGYMGAANAWSGALGGIGNQLSQNSLLTQLGFNGKPPASTYSGPTSYSAAYPPG